MGLQKRLVFVGELFQTEDQFVGGVVQTPERGRSCKPRIVGLCIFFKYFSRPLQRGFGVFDHAFRQNSHHRFRQIERRTRYEHPNARGHNALHA